MTATISIDEAMSDPNLLAGVLGDLSTWNVWRVALKAAFGVALADQELETFRSIASERSPPPRRVKQFWAIVGRRGGKSRMAALICCYLATCIDHRSVLSPGEVGFVLCLAPTQRQASGVLNYCRAFLESSPILAQQILATTTDEIRLRDNVTIAVHPANYRTVRGRTLVACVMDETAQWRDELSALPDVEALRAVVPALLTTKGLVIGISTPYGQRGLLFEKFRDFYGKSDPDTLVIKGSTTTFHPIVDHAQIERELAEDPEGNRSEYLADFRSDLSAYCDRAVVERCVEADCRERPYMTRYKYLCFVDPSGGQHDSFCAGVAHRDGARIVLDKLVEWKAPFVPADVVVDIVALLKSYRLHAVTGDAYGSGWVQGEFKDHGIHYRVADKDKSTIFIDALPLLTSGDCVLLDDPRLVGQISQLQRETGRAVLFGIPRNLVSVPVRARFRFPN